MNKTVIARTPARLRALFALPLVALACASAFAADAPASTLAASALAAQPLASNISLVNTKVGPTPFISNAFFSGSDLANVTGVGFIIQPAAGALAKPVKVHYSIDNLKARGFATAPDALTLPVFGLYAGVVNSVAVQFDMAGTKKKVYLTIQVKAPKYTDPNKVYDRPTIVTPLRADALPGFDYMYMKSGLGSPVIVDIDGAVRWVGPPVDSSFSSAFVDGGFMIGIHKQAGVYRMELDGTTTEFDVQSNTVDWFNHNIVFGRDAMLTGTDNTRDGVVNVQSTITEMTTTGAVIREWDFAKIIGDYMTGMGDDASAFVHPGSNWLHLNNSLYDPSDDSLIVSSREQFVMKVDYDTGAIKWILGDPTKWWYTFPSLRAKALSMKDGSFWPIGQHGITLTSDGALLLFNNGAPSYGLPPGEPAGESRKFSTANAYTIDANKMKAVEVMRYTHGKTLKSNVCSSAYEGANHTLLVDYAAADDGKHANIVALDQKGNTLFEYEYANRSCGTAWNTEPIPFENLEIK